METMDCLEKNWLSMPMVQPFLLVEEHGLEKILTKWIEQEA